MVLDLSRCCFGQWGKASSVRWLVGLLVVCLLLSLTSVIAIFLGLVGAKAQGKGSCYVPPQKPYLGLGKWDDGPASLHLNWYVCKYSNKTADADTKQQLVARGWQWHGEAFYRASCGWHRHEVAEKLCQGDGAHLVTIQSSEENEFVQKLCGFETCWIGLREKENSEEWVWPDGSVAGSKPTWHGYTNWYEGEPNNNRGVDESVAYMSGWFRLDMPDPSTDAGECDDVNSKPRSTPTGTGKWFDVNKAFRIKYSVCEMSGDAEVCQKQGYSAFEGSCYLKHCAMSNYLEADNTCRYLGFDGLVTINSLRENQHVRRICGLNTCRIGLSKVSNEWQWGDGKRVGKPYAWKGYVNWNEGEPNNWGGDQDSAVLNINDMIAAIRVGMLFGKISPLYNVWAMIELGLPLILLVAVCVASRFHSACFASCIRSTSAMASFWLVLLIVMWLYLFGHVNEDWPSGSRLLFVCLSIASILQLVTCCMATAKAQELQWATTGPWSSMGTRTVATDFGNDSGVSLSADVTGTPGTA